MPRYYDSSVVLSLILGDAHTDQARQLWDGDLERVSSILCEIECISVMRRLPRAIGAAERRSAEERLATALDELTIKPLDEDILALVRTTAALAGCRSLDAAHLATALYFRDAADEFAVVTFDTRMAEAASRLGLRILGL